jgi:hypothetical protein
MVPATSIVETLKHLDPKNDEQWTAQGLPRVEAVASLLGVEDLTRKEITEAAPDFNREVAMEVVTLAELVDDSEAEDEAAEEEEALLDELAGESLVSVSDSESVLGTENVESEKSQVLTTELDRLEARRTEKTQEMLKAQRVAEAAKNEADRLANEVNNLNRAIDRYEKADPNSSTAGVRAYIAQQNKNRHDRMAGLRRFIELTGSKPTDVQNALDPRAPIDRARARRTGYGHGFPKRV